MCQSQSVGSYEQAGEVSRMELQRGHEDLYRKEPSENSSYDLPRTATLSVKYGGARKSLGLYRKVQMGCTTYASHHSHVVHM